MTALLFCTGGLILSHLSNMPVYLSMFEIGLMFSTSPLSSEQVQNQIGKLWVDLKLENTLWQQPSLIADLVSWPNEQIQAELLQPTLLWTPLTSFHTHINIIITTTWQNVTQELKTCPDVLLLLTYNTILPSE